MRIGLGHLHMRPDDFWRMTLPEFFAACDGYLESRGVRKAGRVAAPTRAEVDALFAQLDDQGRLKSNG
ncbi:putative phage protein (TIGR02216 family) [Methylosinus sp. sav-2]|uniref:phage tail assembly chaperone n=1 Tax=Methylosinus sp. sav-2 TaxID=2485168 RepID=UPI00055FDBE6|nr:phage tail assembly chaperone [Methylosinus sp. sav-2]TDX61923.1 putative phage protein (TIGR02216 family) [Methylosinus sp. sav-2]